MITVEPCVALFMVSVNLTNLANINLVLDKTCRINLGQSDDLCDQLKFMNISSDQEKS